MPGMATSSGSRTIRSVNGSARVSRSTSEPANAIRPSRMPTASTQPNPVSPASVAIRPLMSMSRGICQVPTGSASSLANPSRSSPAPSPTANATRAFVAHRCPTGSAPARTHVAPPPGKAYAVPAAPDGQRLARATGMSAPIARTAEASRRGSVFPAPVAATTTPSAPAEIAASSRAPSIATVAVTRWTCSAARVAATIRRRGRRRGMATSSASARPSDPAFGLANVVSDVECILRASSAGSIEPPRQTTTPASRIRGSPATRTASRRLAGPSNPGASDERIAPVTTTGFITSRTRSQKNAVSSIVSVPWTTTMPSTLGSAAASRIVSAMSNSIGKVKWLAGVRPRSTATTSATAGRPGVRPSSAAPWRTGRWPRAAGPNAVLRAPPVNTTTTRGIGGLGAVRGVERACGLVLEWFGGRRTHQDGDRVVGLGGRPAPLRLRDRAPGHDRDDADDRDGDGEGEDDRGGPDRIRNRADDDDRQEARNGHEHPEDAEDATSDVFGQVLLERRLRRDRDEPVCDAREERDDHDDGQERCHSRQVDPARLVGTLEKSADRTRCRQGREQDAQRDQAGLDDAAPDEVVAIGVKQQDPGHDAEPERQDDAREVLRLEAERLFREGRPEHAEHADE